MTKENKKNYIIWSLLSLIVILIIAISSYLNSNIAGHLVINEIAFNQEDEVDWIELYNPTLNNLSLKGLYFSDKSNNFSKYEIKEDVIVPSQGYVVIYGDGYQGNLDNSFVTNFRIANGETVFLVGKDGATIIDSLTVIKSEEQTKDATIGRFPDGSDEVFIFSEATPKEKNRKDMILDTKLNFEQYE